VDINTKTKPKVAISLTIINV